MKAEEERRRERRKRRSEELDERALKGEEERRGREGRKREGGGKRYTRAPRYICMWAIAKLQPVVPMLVEWGKGEREKERREEKTGK
jgi:hypothetical protein